MKAELIANYTQEKVIEDLGSELLNQRILIVDDMEFNQIILNEILNNKGYANTLLACNGIDALQKCETFKPNLVILDLVMPDCDGYEFLEKFREIDKFKLTPVIVQTVVNAPEEKVRAFSCGATDFVTKPVDSEELLARTKIHLERQKLYDDIFLAKSKMEEELQDAQKMQNQLMPTNEYLSFIERRYGIAIYSLFKPSSQLGGDFWGVSDIDDSRLAIYNIDFSGHGVSAAMNIFRLDAILKDLQEEIGDPAKFLTILNQKICNVLNRGHYATMFHGIIDIDKDTLTYSAASTPAPIYITKGCTANELDGSGFPLGTYKGANYINRTVDFPVGSMIMLYSDALIETEDTCKKFWDLSEIKTSVENSWYRSSSRGKGQDLYNNLTREFNDKFSKNLRDDLTINIYFRY